MSEEIEKGLEGVVVDESSLGNIDGEKGKLWYCGYNIDDLVENSSYEEVLFLLFNQRLPDSKEYKRIEDDLKDYRELSEYIEEVVDSISDSQPMDILRSCVSLLASSDDDPDSLEDAEDKAMKITAKIPTILAYTYRYRNDKEPVEPDTSLSHAANFLYMLRGEEPSEEEAEAMDDAMVLYAEHGMNASTFAGSVTVSTLASMYSSVTSAIGALQGSLHGGATETVMDMIDEVGSPENAEEWVEEKLDNHENIPGFGHRVYRHTDPRCNHFRRNIEELASGYKEREKRLETIEEIRSSVEERLGEKDIWPNTDLYSGTMYNMLGLPRDFYTALFAMSRVAGWTAHILEQLEDNRIFRPRVKYTGKLDREHIPMEER